MTSTVTPTVAENPPAFTPGPWRAEYAVDMLGNQTGKLWIIMQAQPCGYDFDHPADACLAATAPELHDALNELEDALAEGLCDSGIPGFDYMRLERARQNARAVLAKARGESL